MTNLNDKYLYARLLAPDTSSGWLILHTRLLGSHTKAFLVFSVFSPVQSLNGDRHEGLRSIAPAHKTGSLNPKANPNSCQNGLNRIKHVRGPIIVANTLKGTEVPRSQSVLYCHARDQERALRLQSVLYPHAR